MVARLITAFLFLVDPSAKTPPHGDFLTRPFGSGQFLDCAFGGVPAWIFPNLLVDNYLIDCIALASFTHSHALATELSTSFWAESRHSEKVPSPWTLATTTPLILTTRCRHYECIKISSRRQFFSVHDTTRRTGRRMSQCSWVDEISVGVWSQANGRQKMLRIERTVYAMIPTCLPPSRMTRFPKSLRLRKSETTQTAFLCSRA